MTDPYSVLGIGRDSTDDEVKKAYRNLVRKYHPDKNPGNKAAEDMFKVVQEAYDQIMDERKNGYSSGGQADGYGYGYGNAGGTGYGYGYGQAGYGQGSQQTYSGAESTYYQAAANYINSRHYREALNTLSNVKERTAQWYYLSALANAGLGNNYVAQEQAQTAASMEPGNFMYANLVNNLRGGGFGYQNMNRGYGSNTMFDDNLCLKLCMLNLLCNTCDGDMCCCC